MPLEIVRSVAPRGKPEKQEVVERLPEGFPILLDSDTREIIEPALWYLISRKGMRPNTILSEAQDLKDWWEYLRHLKHLTWHEIGVDTIEDYRDAMLQTVSPKTHAQYTVSTIRRRVGTVKSFYTWSNAKGFVERPLDFQGLLPRQRTGIDDHVHALTPGEVGTVFALLGPLPSEQKKDPRPSRDRLMAEVSLNAGLRRDEVRSLPVQKILGLRADPNIPDGACFLQLTKTKGLRKRKAVFPNWLVDELHEYYGGERAEILKEYVKANGNAAGSAGAAFFLNGLSSRHNLAKPVSNDTIDRQFHKAVVTAEFVHLVERVDPETAERYTINVPDHVFHSLRHTFAIWRYHAESAAGNREPWKVVQALLGHKSLQTTLNYYLRPSAEFEALVSDRVLNFFQGIRRGQRER